MKIELEDLFIQKLKDGINLFTGAGFSVLPSKTGEKLPTGNELCDVLRKKYLMNDIPDDQGLAYVSEFCPEQEYQNYLRSRLTVSSYNPLYYHTKRFNFLN